MVIPRDLDGSVIDFVSHIIGERLHVASKPVDALHQHLDVVEVISVRHLLSSAENHECGYQYAKRGLQSSH